MNEIIQFPPVTTPDVGATNSARETSAIRTDTVYVLYAGIEQTLGALRVAADFAAPRGFGVTVIHVRTVPYALPVDEPTGVSPLETDDFVHTVQAECHDVQVRVYLCRDERQGIRLALRPHSLIVMGGRPSWWPTPAERRRRMLERAGHFVVFVDTSDGRVRGGHEQNERRGPRRREMEAFRA